MSWCRKTNFSIQTELVCLFTLSSFSSEALVRVQKRLKPSKWLVGFSTVSVLSAVDHGLEQRCQSQRTDYITTMKIHLNGDRVWFFRCILNNHSDRNMTKFFQAIINNSGENTSSLINENKFHIKDIAAFFFPLFTIWTYFKLKCFFFSYKFKADLKQY